MRQTATNRKDHWQTPQELLDLIHEEIDLDPCAGKGTDIGTFNFTQNGLTVSWYGVVFVNPPFSEKEAWLEKAVKSAREGMAKVVYVVTPDSTDTKSWWHEFIAPNARYIWFSEGRIDYVDPETGEQEKGVGYGTTISIFGRPHSLTLDNMMEEGHLVKTVNR